MDNWNNLKDGVIQAIQTNGNQDITGDILQNNLLAIINNLGDHAKFVGVAIPSTVAITNPDGQIFYFASAVGTYANFGGLIVRASELVVFTNNGRGGWLKIVIANYVSPPELGSFIPQKYIDPMQGQYTSFSSSRENVAASISGDLAPIGMDDFMIEFTGAMEHGDPVVGRYQLQIMDGDSRLLGILGGGLGLTLENRLYGVYFNHTHTIINKVKPIGSLFHVVCCKQGSDYFAMVDGVRYDSTVSLYNFTESKVELSFASRTSRLRKFNFADETFAQTLWNGGRWMEKVIDNNYREPISADWYTHMQNALGSADTETITPTYTDVQVTALTTNTNTDFYPRIFTTSLRNIGEKGFIEVMLDAECTDIGGLTLGGLRGTRALSQYQVITGRKIYIFRGYLDPLIATDNGQIFQGMGTESNLNKTLRIYSYHIEHKVVQNEYLPSSLTKTVWRDTQGGSDLATITIVDPDDIVLNTAPLLTQILWGEGAPTFAPDAIGQTYIDTTNKVTYTAYGTTNANDWE